jgi:multidrug efflux pump subunit AcrB
VPPLGFVAILGVLALIGILVRNSVILIVQVEDLKKEGRPAWDAVVEATEHRMRPILLTAAAASLTLIPIARELAAGTSVVDDISRTTLLGPERRHLPCPH